MTVKMVEIRVSGSCHKFIPDPREGLTITPLGDDVFLITARLVDQPALHGLLDRIHAAGLVLLSLRYMDDPFPETNKSLI